MPSRAMRVALVAGVLLGVALGAGAGWLAWGRRVGAMTDRVAGLESAATQVQGERERLRRELADIVRERREMAATAEHLRAQVDQQIHRLEVLSSELAPPEEAAPDTPP